MNTDIIDLTAGSQVKDLDFTRNPTLQSAAGIAIPGDYGSNL
jgi:hypothetical protein